MSKLVPINIAARTLGVSTSTLRWDATGKLTPARTENGHRRYDLAALRPGVANGANVVKEAQC